MNNLIIFDLDNTLTKGNSWARLNIGMGMTSEEDILLSTKYQQTGDFQWWSKKILEIYHKRGMPTKNQIIKILNNFELNNGVEYCIKELKKMGYILTVVSGSPDIFTELACKKMGIDIFRSVYNLIFDEKGFLTNIAIKNEEKSDKLTYGKEICSSLGLNMEESIIIGDGENEEMLFDISKFPITFQNGKLANKAWKLIGGLSDLPIVLKRPGI